MDFNMFKHINKSFPKAECLTNFEDIVSYCILKEAEVEIKLKG